MDGDGWGCAMLAVTIAAACQTEKAVSPVETVALTKVVPPTDVGAPAPPAPADPVEHKLVKAEAATKMATQRKVCGFADFTALESAMTAAAMDYTYKVVRDPDEKGPPTKWGPTGEPPPLGPPPAVGSCRLHATNVFVHRYQLRYGSQPIAEVWDSGVVLKAPGFSFDGVAVGSLTDDVLKARKADKLTCNPTGIGNFCRFTVEGATEAPGIDFIVKGKLEQSLDGQAAITFFRGKQIAGINFDRW